MAHPAVPVISFTGSSEVGKRIMARPRPSSRNCRSNWGGNDPVIVFADADLERVARNVVRGRMAVGNGQACVADKRFFIQALVYRRVVELAGEVVRSLRVGNPQDPSADVGPLIHETAAKRVEVQIADAVDRGATLVTGGRRVNRTFIEPAVLSDV